jgi:hypothetical protein
MIATLHTSNVCDGALNRAFSAKKEKLCKCMWHLIVCILPRFSPFTTYCMGAQTGELVFQKKVM